jgi:biopolymer transport protein TolQ
MENEAVNAAGLVAASQELNFSVWNLFLKADTVVKLVMLLLIVASVWCWAIIIEKSLRLKRLNSEAAEFEGSFWSGGSLDTLYDKIGTLPKDPMAAIFVSAMKEWRRSIDSGVTNADHGSSVTDRIDRVMDVTLNREIERVERQITILASTGSTAPFIGLFGTVWGIMNSFQSIAISKNTSLAVVAPGIAEALFATALGLLAAVPAVIAYNKISKDVDRYAARLEDFSSEFSAIISRQLDG